MKQLQSALALESQQSFCGLLLTFPVADYNEFSLLHPPSWYSCTAHSLALMHQKNDVYWLWSFRQSSGLMHLLTCSSLTCFSLVINLFHSFFISSFTSISQCKLWLQRLCKILLPPAQMVLQNQVGFRWRLSVATLSFWLKTFYPTLSWRRECHLQYSNIFPMLYQ